MNKRGFTLIELLAIIVILAIIAVITVPIILNIIETARRGAAKNSVTGYGKAVELAYTKSLYEQELSIDGDKDTDGKKTIELTIKESATDIPGKTQTLVVDYEGDDVVCGSTEDPKKSVGTITAGKLVLENCSVGKYSGYKYEKGNASIPKE